MVSATTVIHKERQASKLDKSRDMHGEYCATLDEIRRMRRAKWAMYGTAKGLDKVKRKLDAITLKLAYLIVNISDDEERSIWQKLYQACERW